LKSINSTGKIPIPSALGELVKRLPPEKLKGTSIGAYKIFDKLYENNIPTLNLILCTQYYRGPDQYNLENCKTYGKKQLKDEISICNYFSRIWSLTNTTLQFGLDLIQNNGNTQFGSKLRRLSYSKKIKRRSKKVVKRRRSYRKN